MPEHPSNAAINTLRNGQGTFLGKGDDGLVYDTHDGNVAKVTTVVPYNLQNFRHHTHAVADARRQAEINNQAYNEGHDIFLPQQFEEHGEKGFTIRPKLEIGGSLSPMQIAEYRDKMQRAWDAGWRINDSVQHGVDAEGRIRVYDTGKMSKISPSQDPQGFDLDDWGQLTHARKLMREHGHYDEQSDSDDIRDFLNNDSMQQLAWYNSQHDPKDKVNPLETFAPSQWKRFTDAIYDLIRNESEELGFHVDDIRALLDEIDSQVKATRQTQPAFTAKTNDENADFWITRKGGEKTVGTPHKDFRKESIGITVDKNQLDPAYAFYLFQHVKDNLKFWEPRAKGTLNLKNITLRDVKELAKQVAPADTKPVPKGYGVILPLRKALDKYESETANRVLDKRLLNAQAIFDNAVTEYEQYDDDDLPHGESLDAYIYDKDLFSQLVPDLSEQDLATLALAAYRTGIYHDDDNFLVAGFEIEPSELSYGSDTRDAIVSALELQTNLGLNHKGEKFAIGQKDYEGMSYEPETIREHEYDAFLRNRYPETDDFGSAGFITADGAMLDLSDGSGSRIIDHRDAAMTDEAAMRWGLKPDMGKDYSQYHKLHHILYNANAIRFDANANMLDMPAYPTTAQLQTIANFIKEYAPDYMVLRLGDVEWEADNPTIGLLMRQFESVANGINPGDEGWPGSEYDDEEEDYYAARYGAEDDPINPDNLDDGTKPEPKTDSSDDYLTIAEPKGRTYEKGLGKQQSVGQPLEIAKEAVLQPDDFEQFDHKAYANQPMSINDGARLISDYEYHLEGNHAPLRTGEYAKENIERSHLVPDLYPRDEKLQELYKRVHRADNDHPDEENDEYYYHVTQAPNAATYLSEENLQDQNPAGLDLIEKQDLRYWMSYNAHKQRQYNINRHKLAYEKEPLEEGQERLQNKQAAEHFFNWEQAAKSSPLDFDDIQVHRVPKSKIQPYVARSPNIENYDPVAGYDYPAFTTNTTIKQQVRYAREQIGSLEKITSEENKTLNELTTQRDEIKNRRDDAYAKLRKSGAKANDTIFVLDDLLAKRALEAAKTISVKKVGVDEGGTDDPMTGKPRDVYAIYSIYYEQDENGNRRAVPFEVYRAAIGRRNLQAKTTPLGTAADNELEAAKEILNLGAELRNLFLEHPAIPDRDYHREQRNLIEREGREKAYFGMEPMIKRLRAEAYGAETHSRQGSYAEAYFKYQLANEIAAQLKKAGVPIDPKPFGESLNDAANLFKADKELDSFKDASGKELSLLLMKTQTNQLRNMQLKVASNPEYHRWSPNNKAVDEQGLPLIIFHGTDSGGFDEFQRGDVEGHVYGSTNVDVAATYTGGNYRDDVTPALANTVEDVAASLSNSPKLQMARVTDNRTGQQQYAVVKHIGYVPDPPPLSREALRESDKLIPLCSEEEFVVRWNKWITSKDRTWNIEARGVYPLIFSLQKPFIVDGQGARWSDIPVMPADAGMLSTSELLENRAVAEFVDMKFNGYTPELIDDIRGYVERYKQTGDVESAERMERRIEQLIEKVETGTYNMQPFFDMIDEIALEEPASEILHDLFEVPRTLTTREWAQFAEDLGHDGIIWKDIYDLGAAPDASGLISDVFVAFDYSDVKSAHNIGGFGQKREDRTKLLYSAVN